MIELSSIGMFFDANRSVVDRKTACKTIPSADIRSRAN